MQQRCAFNILTVDIKACYGSVNRDSDVHGRIRADIGSENTFASDSLIFYIESYPSQHINFKADLVCADAIVITYDHTASVLNRLGKINQGFDGMRCLCNTRIDRGLEIRRKGDAALIRVALLKILLGLDYLLGFNQDAANRTLLVLDAVHAVFCLSVNDPLTCIVKSSGDNDLIAMQTREIIISVISVFGNEYLFFFAVIVLNNAGGGKIRHCEEHTVLLTRGFLDDEHKVGLIAHRAGMLVAGIQQRYIIALTVLYIRQQNILVVDRTEGILIEREISDFLANLQCLQRRTVKIAHVCKELVLGAHVLVEGADDHFLDLNAQRVCGAIFRRIPDKYDRILGIVQLS